MIIMPRSLNREFSSLHSEQKPDLVMSATNRVAALWWVFALFFAVLFIGSLVAMETKTPNIPVEQIQTVNPNISAPSLKQEPNGPAH
jgi:hypothetical protein